MGYPIQTQYYECTFAHATSPIQDIERANNVKIAARTKKLSRMNKSNPPTSHRPHQSDAPEQKIHQIRIGDYLIDTWYNAPYPEEYSKRPILYICEYCLKYIKSEYTANRHKVWITRRCIQITLKSNRILMVNTLKKKNFHLVKVHGETSARRRDLS